MWGRAHLEVCRPGKFRNLNSKLPTVFRSHPIDLILLRSRCGAWTRARGASACGFKRLGVVVLSGPCTVPNTEECRNIPTTVPSRGDFLCSLEPLRKKKTTTNMWQNLLLFGHFETFPRAFATRTALFQEYSEIVGRDRVLPAYLSPQCVSQPRSGV